VPPRPLHPVIVGYNGSLSARNAIAYAAGMAKRQGRPLLVVYVRTRLGHPAWELAAVATELSADALVIGASARFWHRTRGVP